MMASRGPGSPVAPRWGVPLLGSSSFPLPGPSGRSPSVFVGPRGGISAPFEGAR